MSIRNPVVEPRSSVNEEREILTKVITRWNEHRLDLFEISLPNENLDFFGVIRFYFHDNQQSVATTKCLRVSSTAVSKMVIDALIEKFRPDMRMLGSSYALYEVHQSGGKRLTRRHLAWLLVCWKFCFFCCLIASRQVVP